MIRIRRLTLPALAVTLLLAAAPADAQGRPGGPLPVQNINPVVHRILVTGSQSGAVSFDEFPLEAVPEGKRFVVEHVSAEVIVDPAQIPRARITGTSPTGPFYAIPLVKQASLGIIADAFQASLPIRFYLDAGQTYLLSANRNPSGGVATFEVTLSGYLIDLPLP